MRKKIEELKKDEKSEFEEIDNKIVAEIQKEPLHDTDNIGNIALLDASTNRGYGNALYPTTKVANILRFPE